MPMQIYTDIFDLPPAAKGAVLTLGNFDGVHPGHLALMQHARDIAQDIARVDGLEDVPAAVMTFDPHPRRFFVPDAPPFSLTLFAQKAACIADAGMDILYALNFNATLAQLTGDEFAQLLKDKLAPRHIVIGHDFAFGRARSGNVDTLRRICDVTALLPVICPDGTPYSSSRIRAALQEADFATAAKLLGRPFEIEGEVVHGDKQGRLLGYPTANQKAGDYLRLPFGIYAVEAQIGGEDIWRGGVANFGIRPMFRVEQPLFETVIFDFDREIYGKILKVRPLKYLRPEQHFDSLDALKDQMKQDCLDARAMLKSRSIQQQPQA